MEVLIIDDSDVICDLYSDMLSSRGDSVTSVNNGKDGLGLLAKKEYDLILLDICMPEYDGIQFLEDLEKQKPSDIKKVSVISRLAHDENLAVELKKFGITSIQENLSSMMNLENPEFPITP